MATALSTWTDGYWWSNDGLRLHYRDDAGSSERPPILCLPALDTLASVPTLVVRGKLSDLLATAPVELMLGRLFAGTSVTVPRVGHAPVLDEPVASAAIDALLARVV